MTCREFERWLDDGMPTAGAAAFLDHAKSCPACERSRAATLAFEAALARSATAAPVGFADRVLARIEHPMLAPILAPATPWWLRALTEPAGLLALLLIALLTTGWETMWAVLGTGAIALGQTTEGTWLAAAETVARTPWGALLGKPEVVVGLELGTLCLAVVVMPPIYRLSLRIATRAARPVRR